MNIQTRNNFDVTITNDTITNDSSGTEGSSSAGSGGDAESLLAAPGDMAMFGGDPALMIGAMMIEQSRNQRETLRRSEQAADDRQIAAEEKEARDLHDEASSMRVEGWVEGVSDIASGVAQGVAADYNYQSAMSGAKTQAAEQALSGALWSVGAKFADASSHLFGGQFRAAQKDMEGVQKDDAKTADEAKKFGDNERDMIREVDDQTNKVLDFMRSFIEEKHQASAAATRRA